MTISTSAGASLEPHPSHRVDRHRRGWRPRVLDKTRHQAALAGRNWHYVAQASSPRSSGCRDAAAFPPSSTARSRSTRMLSSPRFARGCGFPPLGSCLGPVVREGVFGGRWRTGAPPVLPSGRGVRGLRGGRPGRRRDRGPHLHQRRGRLGHQSSACCATRAPARTCLPDRSAQPGFIRDGTWGGSVRRIESEEPSTRRKSGHEPAPFGTTRHYVALRGTRSYPLHLVVVLELRTTSLRRGVPF